MAPSTVPAFVHKGDWSAESDDHPAMKWMHSYTKMVDRKVWETEPWQDWHTDDYALIKSDGTKISGGEAAWKGLAEIYGPFVAYHHEPYYLNTVETDYGYQMIGQAHVYVTLPGKPADGEPPKVKDGKGKEWDVSVPGAFHFEYRKDDSSKHGGFKLQKTEIMSESLPIAMMMVKRGVIQLG